MSQAQATQTDLQIGDTVYGMENGKKQFCAVVRQVSLNDHVQLRLLNKMKDAEHFYILL